MNIKFYLIPLILLGNVFFVKNLQGQSSQPGYKDSSQTITREELRQAQEVNKIRRDKARAFKKEIKATDKRNKGLRDSLYNTHEKKKIVRERSQAKKSE